MRIRDKLIAMLLLAAGSTAANATPIIVWCNNCNGTQINTAVLTSGAAVGVPVYVGDLITGAYGAYDWYSDIDDSKHPPVRVKYVESIAGDVNILKGVHAYIQFYQLAPVGWTKHESLVYNGPDPKATGWTVATFGQTQTNFNTWLNNNGSPAGNGAQLLGIGEQLAGNIVNLPQQIETVTFPDGSTINTVQNNSCGCLNAFPDSARDGEGNPIPYLDSNGKLHNGGGQRHFANTAAGERDFTNYQNAIHNMPVVLMLNGQQVGGGGTGGGSGPQPEICVETPNSDGTTDVNCYAG